MRLLLASVFLACASAYTEVYKYTTRYNLVFSRDGCLPGNILSIESVPYDAFTSTSTPCPYTTLCYNYTLYSTLTVCGHGIPANLGIRTVLLGTTCSSTLTYTPLFDIKNPAWRKPPNLARIYSSIQSYKLGCLQLSDSKWYRATTTTLQSCTAGCASCTSTLASLSSAAGSCNSAVSAQWGQGNSVFPTLNTLTDLFVSDTNFKRPYGECTPDYSCDPDRVGDGHCDLACNTTGCDYDLGDCVPCAAGCEPGWQHDTVCDPECNNAACGFDDYYCPPFCAPGCRQPMIGDVTCDLACNVSACNFDGGDCTPYCSYTTLNVCPTMSQTNQNCDWNCNIAQCNFDNGQCTNFCAQNCINTMRGDGNCDDACNKAQCNYDNGDCTAFNCAPNCFNDLPNNGVCDSACNNAACGFDGTDCHATPGILCTYAAGTNCAGQPLSCIPAGKCGSGTTQTTCYNDQISYCGTGKISTGGMTIYLYNSDDYGCHGNSSGYSFKDGCHHIADPNLFGVEYYIKVNSTECSFKLCSSIDSTCQFSCKPWVFKSGVCDRYLNPAGNQIMLYPQCQAATSVSVITSPTQTSTCNTQTAYCANPFRCIEQQSFCLAGDSCVPGGFNRLYTCNTAGTSRLASCPNTATYYTSSTCTGAPYQTETISSGCHEFISGTSLKYYFSLNSSCIPSICKDSSCTRCDSTYAPAPYTSGCDSGVKFVCGGGAAGTCGLNNYVPPTAQPPVPTPKPKTGTGTATSASPTSASPTSAAVTSSTTGSTTTGGTSSPNPSAASSSAATTTGASAASSASSTTTGSTGPTSTTTGSPVTSASSATTTGASAGTTSGNPASSATSTSGSPTSSPRSSAATTTGSSAASTTGSSAASTTGSSAASTTGSSAASTTGSSAASSSGSSPNPSSSQSQSYVDGASTISLVLALFIGVN